jgi:ABC-type lipoprotein release transport system permease subunit
MNDLKFAFRQLLKHPGSTNVAVLTLALGIAVMTVITVAIMAALLPSVRPSRFDPARALRTE